MPRRKHFEWKINSKLKQSILHYLLLKEWCNGKNRNAVDALWQKLWWLQWPTFNLKVTPILIGWQKKYFFQGISKNPYPGFAHTQVSHTREFRVGTLAVRVRSPETWLDLTWPPNSIRGRLYFRSRSSQSVPSFSKRINGDRSPG